MSGSKLYEVYLYGHILSRYDILLYQSLADFMCLFLLLFGWFSDVIELYSLCLSIRLGVPLFEFICVVQIWALAIGKKTEMLATGGGDAVIKIWNDSTAADKEEAFRKEASISSVISCMTSNFCSC